jgi:hypothetical protein
VLGGCIGIWTAGQNRAQPIWSSRPSSQLEAAGPSQSAYPEAGIRLLLEDVESG